ncbi:MAG: sialidase family protein [Mucilaginibacter sp.]|uniref:sialidase family protein n=1 Tax=Mucilaginibacter sp. TaxID=1882438 RepID=UPI003265B220
MKRAYLLLVLMLCYAAQLLAQTTESYNWGNVAMGGGGFVTGIITSKKAGGPIYARTDVGGAYRWDAANNKWIPLNDFASDSQQGILGVLSIAIDSKNPGTVYMATGISYFNNGKSYILKSTDYGATFSILDVTSLFKINGNANGRQDGERLQVDPVNSSILYCGSQANGLFKSADAGSTWSRLSGLNIGATPNNNGVNFVMLDTNSTATVSGVKMTQRMFVGVSRTGNNNFYRSDDGGNTFTAVTNPNVTDTTQMPHRAVLSNGSLYVTYSNGAGPGGTTAEPCTTGKIWKYNIATSAWTNVTPIIQGGAVNKPYCGISVDPNNANRLLATTVNNYTYQYDYQGSGVYGDKIYYSTDAGATWIDIVARGFSLNANGAPWITGQSIHWAGSVEFDPSNLNSVFLVSGNGIFVNNDITAAAGTWNFTVKGVEETVPQNMVSIPGGNLVSVIGDYDGFTQTDPLVYAANRHIPSMGSTTGLDYAATSKKVVRVASSMYYSTDQGITWINTAGAIKGTNGQVALSADGNVFLHCPANSATTYRSIDNGATWTAVNGLDISNARPVADGSNPAKFYAYNNGPMMVSTDGGINFSAAGNAGSGGSKIIRTIPGREGHIWVALGSGGLTHSEDSGTSFSKATNVTYCGSVGIGKALTYNGYETIYIYGTVSGTLGIHRSSDKGATWVRVNDDNHQYGGPGNGHFVQGDMNVYGRVYMSTAGRGIVLGTSKSKTPSDIKLGSTDIYRNNALGAVIGSLATTSPDPDATFTYALVSGTGAGDNAAFTITGVQLTAAMVFNYATKQTYNIRIRSTTGDGATFEKAFVINIKNLSQLPIKNFKVSATNETCSDNNDGKINITATQNLNYKATVSVNNTSTDYPFTTALEVSPLNAGTYTIASTGQSDYKQCYDLTITEPKPLSVYSAVDLPGKDVVLSLDGGTTYQVELNGQAKSVTADTVKLSLVNGRNDIVVITEKDSPTGY